MSGSDLTLSPDPERGLLDRQLTTLMDAFAEILWMDTFLE